MPKTKPDVLQVELLETEKGYVEAVALAFVPPEKKDKESGREHGEFLPVTCWGGPFNGSTFRLYPDGQDGCVTQPGWLGQYVLAKNAKADVVLVPKDELTVAFRKTRPPKKKAKCSGTSG